MSQPQNEDIDSNMPKTKAENSELLIALLQPCGLLTTEPNHLMNSRKCDKDEKIDNQNTDTENNIPMPAYSAPPKPIINPHEMKVVTMTDHALLPVNAPSQPDSNNNGWPPPPPKKKKKNLGWKKKIPLDRV
jgi:hypothetical protein